MIVECRFKGNDREAGQGQSKWECAWSTIRAEFESVDSKRGVFTQIKKFGWTRGQPLAGLFNDFADRTLLSCQRVGDKDVLGNVLTKLNSLIAHSYWNLATWASANLWESYPHLWWQHNEASTVSLYCSHHYPRPPSLSSGRWRIICGVTHLWKNSFRLERGESALAADDSHDSYLFMVFQISL